MSFRQKPRIDETASELLDRELRSNYRRSVLGISALVVVLVILLFGYSVWRDTGTHHYVTGTIISGGGGAVSQKRGGSFILVQLADGTSVRVRLEGRIPVRRGEKVILVRADRAFLKNGQYIFHRYTTESDIEL